MGKKSKREGDRGKGKECLKVEEWMGRNRGKALMQARGNQRSEL